MLHVEWYKFKGYFCRNWPIFVFLRRYHTRAETQRAQKLFLDPTQTMVSSGNGPLPGGHYRCAQSWYRPPPALSFHSISTMGFCVTDFLATIIAIVIDNASIMMHLSLCNVYKPPFKTPPTSPDSTVCSSTRSTSNPAAAAVAVPLPLPLPLPCCCRRPPLPPLSPSPSPTSLPLPNATVLPSPL
jgi:hypothetical protein